MSTPSAPPAALAAALARVEARLAAAEAALAAGAEIPLDELEGCVDALCRDSVGIDAAARGAARSALEGLLARIDALEAAIVSKSTP